MESIGMRVGALSAFVALALCGSTLAAIAQQPTVADLVDWFDRSSSLKPSSESKPGIVA
jgi:hypothetical protein